MALPAPLLPRWPTQCAVCLGWARSRICSDCLARHAAPRPRCAHCAIGVPAGAPACGACLLLPPPWASAVAAVDYGFPWSRLVAAFKFRAAHDLAPALAELLCDAVRHRAAPPPTLIVPVPLSPERLAERGMNQAWELARRVARRLQLRSTASCLQRLVDTPHLADLPRAERAARIRGAFALAPAARLRGEHVALVDDVMTSGATAAEATRTLLGAGAASVRIWVLARTAAPGDT